MSTVRVAHICHDDYANYSHLCAKALRAAGVHCDDFKLIAHPFSYPSQSPIVGINHLREVLPSYDIVFVYHTNIDLYQSLRSVIKKAVPVYCDSNYRRDPDAANKVFKGHKIIALGEFSAYTEDYTYILGGVDDSVIGFTPPAKRNIPLIGHFPSNSEVKGTKEIRRTLSAARGMFRSVIDEKQVGYPEQLARMRYCDLYIELFNHTLGGQAYGSFGITALEAAAMGKVVVTNNIHQQFYQKHYGECGLEICNTNLKGRIEQLIHLYRNKHEEFVEKSKSTRQWLVEKHGLIATGQRLKAVIERVQA